VKSVLNKKAAVSQPSEQHLFGPGGRILNIGGCRIYVEEQGPPAGRAVVLVHGFGGSTYSWRHNSSLLSGQGYHVMALDLPGFGFSSRNSSVSLAHPAQAAKIAALLDVLNVKQAFFIGHSMGFSVVFHFAGAYPERVLGLVSVDGALDIKPASRLPSILLGFPPLSVMVCCLLTFFATRRQIWSMLRSAYQDKTKVTPEIAEAYYQRAIRPGWQKALIRLTRDQPLNAIALRPEKYSFPILVIRGEQDRWISQAATDNWKNCLPGVAYYSIPGAGHLVMEEQPALFNQRVLEFLKKGV
jgi:pimeloyl-ACP methyl ester carboxylesterase